MEETSRFDDTVIQLFEQNKHVTKDGIAFWFARDLQKLLGYSDWVNFLNAIERAKTACSGTSNEPRHHFGDTTRMIALGHDAQREVPDVALTRLACYLIAMNADPSKAAVSSAQNYFAFQTRKQEVFDQLTEAQKRLVLRERVKDQNKGLLSAAKEAGVQEYGLFQDAGYRGLYGDKGKKEIQNIKGIPLKEDLLDCIGPVELAINGFRITQAEDMLRRKNIKGDTAARHTHYAVGHEVRKAVQRIGGTMPEDLPREPSIKRLKKSIINQPKKLPPPML